MGTDNFTPSDSGRGRETPQPGRHPPRSVQGTTFITILFLAFWISAPSGASPLESAGQPSLMEEKVDDILARVDAADRGAFVPHAEVLAAVSEMKSLGPSILPILTAKVPRLNPYVLTAAVCVLKDAGFKPAGPVLPKLLGTGPVNPGSHGYEDLNPGLAILRALGRTGGPLATRPILESGDRPYKLGMGCGMLCGRGYQVVVRRVGNRWVMIDLWLAVFS